MFPLFSDAELSDNLFDRVIVVVGGFLEPYDFESKIPYKFKYGKEKKDLFKPRNLVAVSLLNKKCNERVPRMSILWEQMLYQGNFLSDIFSISLPKNSLHMFNLVKIQRNYPYQNSDIREFLAKQRAGGEASHREFLSFLGDIKFLMQHTGMAKHSCSQDETIDTILAKTCEFCKEATHGGLIDVLAEEIIFNNDSNLHVPAFFESYTKGERELSVECSNPNCNFSMNLKLIKTADKHCDMDDCESKVDAKDGKEEDDENSKEKDQDKVEYFMCEVCHKTLCSECRQDCTCGMRICVECSANHISYCEGCNEDICQDYNRVEYCYACSSSYCSDCKRVDFCGTCSSSYCSDCASVYWEVEPGGRADPMSICSKCEASGKVEQSEIDRFHGGW